MALSMKTKALITIERKAIIQLTGLNDEDAKKVMEMEPDSETGSCDADTDPEFDDDSENEEVYAKFKEARKKLYLVNLKKEDMRYRRFLEKQQQALNKESDDEQDQ